MSTSVPPLTDFLAEIPDFRKAHGKRYALLACCCMSVSRCSVGVGRKRLLQLGARTTGNPGSPTSDYAAAGVRVNLRSIACSRALAVSKSNTPLPLALNVLCHLAPGQELEAIAIDGKTLRGSAKQGAEESHLLSALSQRLNIVLGQVAVPDATNETGVLDQLLDLIGTAGYVTTTDALHTQRDIAQAIVDGQGDYLQVVKENQPGLLEDIQTLFEQPKPCKRRFTQPIPSTCMGIASKNAT